MTAPITVDPTTLSTTGATVSSEGDAAAAAVTALSSALSGAGALFGHDAAGVVFGQSYTQAGQSLLDAAASAVSACGKVGFGVQMSALNYARANAASTVGGGEVSVTQPSAPSEFAAPSMPPPMGGGVVAPVAWSLVESFVGDVWPDGDPEQMRTAATAWRTFATAISATAGPVATAGTTLAGQQIPEAGQMGGATGEISTGLTDIAAQAQTLATQVDAFAASVEATQNAIRALLHQLSFAGILEAVGDIFGGENPWDKVREVADEIRTVLDNMKREADASRTLFSQGMNALDSATTSLQSWATKEFVEVFGEDVGTALSQDFKALVGFPAGAFKFLGVTAEGLQQLDPTRFAYDPQGALDAWKSVAESTAVVTNPALLAEKVISDPQGSLDTVKGLVDWKDVEEGDPFRALGYNVVQVGSLFLPGVGEAAPAVDAASSEARVAGAEARAAGAGTRDAAAAAGSRLTSATEGISTKAGEIGTKLDGIKVPEAQGVPGAGGRAPVEAPPVRGEPPTSQSVTHPSQHEPRPQEPGHQSVSDHPPPTRNTAQNHSATADIDGGHDQAMRPAHGSATTHGGLSAEQTGPATGGRGMPRETSATSNGDTTFGGHTPTEASDNFVRPSGPSPFPDPPMGEPTAGNHGLASDLPVPQRSESNGYEHSSGDGYGGGNSTAGSSPDADGNQQTWNKASDDNGALANEGERHNSEGYDPRGHDDQGGETHSGDAANEHSDAEDSALFDANGHYLPDSLPSYEELLDMTATEPDAAHYWSGRDSSGVGVGPDGSGIAEQIASGNGGTTLELTLEAHGMDPLPKWDRADPESVRFWEQASAAYADNASGEVTAVVGSNLRPGNIWQTVEIPRLMDNPDVTRIIEIDPDTGRHTVIFSRGK